MSVRTVDFLESVSFAADLAMGLPGEHAARCCYLASRIAAELGLPAHERDAVYYAGLLTDAGCTAWSSQLANHLLTDEIAARRAFLFYSDFTKQLDTLNWMARYVARDASLPRRVFRMADLLLHGDAFFRDAFRNTIEVAQRFARRLGMPPDVLQTLGFVFERWDGRGMPEGLSGEDIPVPASVVQAAIFLEVFHQRGGPELARGLAQERRGVAFSPTVVDAFLAASTRDGFWKPLESEGVWAAVRTLEPSPSPVEAPADFAVAVSALLADFTDLKAPHAAGHSRRVADLSQRIATRLCLPDTEVDEIYLAALMHDVGQVAIPSFVLEKPSEAVSTAEREAVELHPHHTERILLRLPGHERVAAMAAAHHEHIDGSGYPRGLAGERIPLGARIIGAADRFDDLTHASPDHAPCAPADAIDMMRADVGRSIDRDVFEALTAACTESGAGDGADARASSGGRANAARTRPLPRWPAGLTDREVDVLRLAARGLTRKQVAQRLVVSESTVRAHLEHIYTKIDVSTRAAAALFAMEHGLLE